MNSNRAIVRSLAKCLIVALATVFACGWLTMHSQTTGVVAQSDHSSIKLAAIHKADNDGSSDTEEPDSDDRDAGPSNPGAADSDSSGSQSQSGSSDSGDSSDDDSDQQSSYTNQPDDSSSSDTTNSDATNSDATNSDATNSDATNSDTNEEEDQGSDQDSDQGAHDEDSQQANDNNADEQSDRDAATPDDANDHDDAITSDDGDGRSTTTDDDSAQPEDSQQDGVQQDRTQNDGDEKDGADREGNLDADADSDPNADPNADGGNSDDSGYVDLPIEDRSNTPDIVGDTPDEAITGEGELGGFSDGGADAATLNYSEAVQEQDNWCWAATGTSIMNNMGADVSQADFVNVVKGSLVNEPATSRDIVSGLNAFGFTGDVGGPLSMDQIAANIDNGQPVQALVSTGQAVGHFQTVVGYDRVANTVTVADPWPSSPRISTMDYDDFNSRWVDSISNIRRT